MLEVKNLEKVFSVKSRKLYALNGVSLTLKRGETLGIVGESGCGKSTLGRTILRLGEPSKGEVYFKDENILELSPKRLQEKRKEMQIVFQDPYSSLNPKMTIDEILKEPFVIHKILSGKELDQKIDELLATVGFSSEIKRRFPHEFSGGQRQRINIARALALGPDLIIADEPVSALDVSVQSQILNLLVELRQSHNLSMIFISHDLRVVQYISDRIAVMYLGKIIELADADALYSKPMHPYTAALLQSIPGHKTEVGRKYLLQGDVPSPYNPPSGCYFHPRCPMATDSCKQSFPEGRNLGTKDNPHWVHCHNV
ncbi:MAG: ABC transporter ATP-binding protein [Oligoflexales bacterium]